MSKIITPILFFLLFWISTSNAQVCATPGFDGSSPVGGQVNTYYPPTANTTLAPGANTVILAAVPADVSFGGGTNTYKPFVNGVQEHIKPGDLLLIIQMQDATINSSNSSLYGDGTGTSGLDGLGGTGYTSLGNTGLFEYVVATNDVPLTGGTLTFRGAGVGGGVVNTYNNQDFNPLSTTQGQRTFQVVRVPQYSNVKLISNIAAPPFNGQVGGIIAFDVAGTMNFNGKTIDSSARGFRGGFTYKNAQNVDNYTGYYVQISNDTPTNTKTTGKGESVVGSPRNMWDGFVQVINNVEGMPIGANGRGAPGNGGGGGNQSNAGGGGGGNGGYGGVGGNGYEGQTQNYPNGGRPGSITYPTGGKPNPARLIMGGGGGAGEVNDAALGANGGVGGGIILLNVGSITGSGTLTTNGADGQSTLNDGAAGGGGRPADRTHVARRGLERGPAAALRGADRGLWHRLLRLSRDAAASGRARRREGRAAKADRGLRRGRPVADGHHPAPR
mgnify:CR=1 FL=1